MIRINFALLDQRRLSRKETLNRARQASANGQQETLNLPDYIVVPVQYRGLNVQEMAVPTFRLQLLTGEPTL